MVRLLIVSDSLRVGGIQRSLENLLNIIDYNKYDVTLFLFHNEKKYEERINKNVKIIGGNRLLSLANSTPKEAKDRSLFYFINRKLIAGFCKIFGSNLVYKFLFLFEKKISDFDVVISYSNNINNRSVYFGSNKFVIEKTNANRKITWLHVEYDKMNMDNKINRNEYNKFNTIVHVSYAVRNNFLNYFPDLSKNSNVVYNAASEDKIYILSNEYNVPKLSVLTLVSVGRLEKNKSPESYVNVAKYLNIKNIKFHWWVIGDGPEKNKILDSIQNNNLNNDITIIGEIENPYPYIKNADLFVSASISESFGLAIAEALALKTPVIARYYPAIEELITDRRDGLIAYGNDESLAECIIELINNVELFNFIKMNTKLSINKETICKQFDDLIGECR